MDIAYIADKRKQIDIEIKNINKDYDRLFKMNVTISNYLKNNIIVLKSKIKPIYNFWNFPNKEYKLYFTKSRALDILYSNSLKDKLNILIDDFPYLEDKPLNYEFYIDQDNFPFTVDFNSLFDGFELVLKEFNKGSTYSYEVEDVFAKFNRILNKQINNFNNLKLLIEKKLVIYNQDNKFAKKLYDEYPENCNKIEEILNIFLLYSKILLELFQLQKAIDNNFRNWSTKVSIINVYDNYLDDKIDSLELEKQLIFSMQPKNTK